MKVGDIRAAALRAGLQLMDEVDLVAMEAAVQEDEVSQERGWKLFVPSLTFRRLF